MREIQEYSNAAPDDEIVLTPEVENLLKQRTTATDILPTPESKTKEGKTLKDLAIIIQIRPYVGKDTWLAAGGKHLKQSVNDLALGIYGLDESESKIMYGIITIENGQGLTDWGYSSVKEATEILKRTNPNLPILVISD